MHCAQLGIVVRLCLIELIMALMAVVGSALGKPVGGSVAGHQPLDVSHVCGCPSGQRVMLLLRADHWCSGRGQSQFEVIDIVEDSLNKILGKHVIQQRIVEIYWVVVAGRL
jgi:hypothetical protein